MDIYTFLNSRDIAEHCKKINKTWNPFEMAVIIGRSNKPIHERHAAFREIITSYPDMPTPRVLFSGTPEVRHESYPSLHKKIEEFVSYEKRCLALLKMPELGVFYGYKGFMDKFYGVNFFSTFDKLWTFINNRFWGKDKRRSSGIYKEFFKDSFRVSIKKRYLDEKSSIAATFDIHGNIYELWSDNNGNRRFHPKHFPDVDESIVDLFKDDVYVHVPAPFKKGDILYDTKHKRIFVLNRFNTEIKHWAHEEHSAITWDSLNFPGYIGTLAFIDSKNNLSLASVENHDYYEYYHGKLTEDKRLLHFVSLFWKDELDIDDLLAMNSEILLENVRKGIQKRYVHDSGTLMLEPEYNFAPPKRNKKSRSRKMPARRYKEGGYDISHYRKIY